METPATPDIEAESTDSKKQAEGATDQTDNFMLAGFFEKNLELFALVEKLHPPVKDVAHPAKETKSPVKSAFDNLKNYVLAQPAFGIRTTPFYWFNRSQDAQIIDEFLTTNNQAVQAINPHLSGKIRDIVYERKEERRFASVVSVARTDSRLSNDPTPVEGGGAAEIPATTPSASDVAVANPSLTNSFVGGAAIESFSQAFPSAPSSVRGPHPDMETLMMMVVAADLTDNASTRSATPAESVIDDASPFKSAVTPSPLKPSTANSPVPLGGAAARTALFLHPQAQHLSASQGTSQSTSALPPEFRRISSRRLFVPAAAIADPIVEHGQESPGQSPPSALITEPFALPTSLKR